MSELSLLQEKVLNIIKNNSEKALFGANTCILKNEDIYNLIDKKMRPSSQGYLSVVLNILEKKGIIKKETDSVPGHQGRRRIITILQ